MSHGPEQTHDELKAFCAAQGKRIGVLDRRTADIEDALKAATYTMECAAETLQADGHTMMANEMRKQIADFKQTLGIS